MRAARLAFAASLMISAAGLSACAANGYYDANGYWHSYDYDQGYYSGGAYSANASPAGYYAPNAPASSYSSYSESYAAPPSASYPYTRPGYYDSNGYFVTVEMDEVPGGYFPPRGMCRVWLPNRAPEYQPAVEPCAGIQGRVPAGAYVIYGG